MGTHKFHHSKHHFLCSDERKKKMPVENVLAALEPLEGLTVIDVGCGKGYFTLPFAQAVGAAGRVYAVDTSQDMLAILRTEAGNAKNIIPVLSEESSIPLDDGMADLLFACTVYHEFEDRRAMVAELTRFGRPGARYVVIDWNQRSYEHGPPRKHRITEETVIGDFAAAGLAHVGTFEPGIDYYGLILRQAS